MLHISINNGEKFMHKRIIQKIHSRIGYWIKYQRKQKLILTNDDRFKQNKFILLNNDEYFFNYLPNEAICSRSTLSRIENGKIIYEKSLLLFFLKRFNKKYRISEINQHFIESTINAFYTYFFINNKISIEYLRKILVDADLKIQEDFLWDEDKVLLYKILEWFNDYTIIQQNEFREYYLKFKIYHKSLQDILIYYLAFSVYFNPELWSYHHFITKLIKDEYSTNELLNVFENLFNKDSSGIYKLFYQDYNCFKNSGFLNEIILLTKYIFDKENVFNCNYKNLKYIQLIQKISDKKFQSDSKFEDELFGLLTDSITQENCDIFALLNLIRMEPNPRIINNLVLKIIYPKIKSKSHFRLLLSVIMS
jgi:transcriptional regulator with XRE-family HTH domain